MILENLWPNREKGSKKRNCKKRLSLPAKETCQFSNWALRNCGWHKHLQLIPRLIQSQLSKAETEGGEEKNDTTLWLGGTLYSYTEEMRHISLPGKYWLRSIEAQEHFGKEDVKCSSDMAVLSDGQPWQGCNEVRDRSFENTIRNALFDSVMSGSASKVKSW